MHSTQKQKCVASLSDPSQLDFAAEAVFNLYLEMCKLWNAKLYEQLTLVLTL